MTEQQTTVMRQALEALKGLYAIVEIAQEDLDNRFAWAEMPDAKDAITALRQALADQALDKMAENERELGIQIGADEPVAKYIAEGSEGSLVQLYEDVKIGTNFYTRPQPAAWVGLTDDELADCVPDEAQVIERDGERNRVAMTRQQLHEFVANAAKLREKNKQQGEQA